MSHLQQSPKAESEDLILVWKFPQTVKNDPTESESHGGELRWVSGSLVLQRLLASADIQPTLLSLLSLKLAPPSLSSSSSSVGCGHDASPTHRSSSFHSGPSECFMAQRNHRCLSMNLTHLFNLNPAAFQTLFKNTAAAQTPKPHPHPTVRQTYSLSSAEFQSVTWWACVRVSGEDFSCIMRQWHRLYIKDGVKRFDQNTFKTDCKWEAEGCWWAWIILIFWLQWGQNHFQVLFNKTWNQRLRSSFSHRLVARAGLCSRHTLPLEISIWLWACVLVTCAGCTPPFAQWSLQGPASSTQWTPHCTTSSCSAGSQYQHLCPTL